MTDPTRVTERQNTYLQFLQDGPRTTRDFALESDPTIKIQAEVWGGKRRYATIRRKQENSNRFLVGTDVSITLEVQKDV